MLDTVKRVGVQRRQKLLCMGMTEEILSVVRFKCSFNTIFFRVERERHHSRCCEHYGVFGDVVRDKVAKIFDLSVVDSIDLYRVSYSVS